MPGNPHINQRELLAGNALVVFSARGVIALTGSDRLSYLDSLVSQDVASLAPGDCAEALLLDPQGHIERQMRVFEDGHTTWLLVDEDQAAPLAAFLDRMTFSKDAEARDVSADYLTVGYFLGGSIESQLMPLVAAPHGTSVVWVDPWNHVSLGGWQYAAAVPHPAQHWNYVEALIEHARVDEIASFTSVDEESWDALRIAAWRPRFTREVDAASLPHESDWLRSAVHLAKGCYRGQETVAKVHNLGHPPRRLVQVHLDGSTNELPAVGASVRDGDAEVGHLTSVARHFEDGPIGLAVIKRSVDVSHTLEVDAPSGVQPATQVVIVPPDAGKAVDVPRISRTPRVTRHA